MSERVLLSLGSVNADFQVRVKSAPGTGSTLPAADFVRLGGGKAANRAVLARRLGHSARLFGRVGDDELREQALMPLRRLDVDVAGVSVAPGQATAVSMIAVLPDGKKSIVLAGNANETWDDVALEAVLAAVAAAPQGSLLAADFEVPAAVVARVVDAARKRGLPVVIDPSPPHRVEREVLRGVTAATPNPSEAEALTGVAVKDPGAAAEAGRRMRALGIGIACAKLGDGGCVVTDQEGSTHVPPMPVEAVDSTGAGDAFAGALAVALMERRPVVEAVCLAVAASSLAVTAYGSQPAYPTRDRVTALLPALMPRARRLPSS
ncbi:bifunctional hydroxymethylpyrimidine kinase/phosphomethylpyrimidine kinase [Belnapia sp. T6]|uniref:Ribokinase n=1 Tax=Belnapia mucosa TaxID=2804532 RepID=A0ABS1V125_9PROT|nr:PfkB family carbohydrate kinase [Belnapia mucosa]MBL6455277.1 bifunctional hydroxymethylpyrimidine kinase/phosphomethylpyrimidine kinase [Belnapia mucosa]